MSNYTKVVGTPFAIRATLLALTSIGNNNPALAFDLNASDIILNKLPDGLFNRLLM